MSAMQKTWNRVVIVGLSIAIPLCMAGTAQAAVNTFTVTSTADPGNGVCDATCTLREAITAADDGDGPLGDQDQIVFQAGVTGTIQMGFAGEMTIDEPVAIQGPGAGTLTVSGNDISRIFTVNDVDELGLDIAVSGLTLTDGNLSGPGGFGGAILNNGAEMTIQNATISGNDAGIDGAGGALATMGGEVTIEGSTITGNSSDAGGGAIFALSGIFTDPELTIRDSRIAGNSATGNFGRGGAVAVQGSAPTTTIERSTISGNSTAGAVTGDGGGLSQSGGTTRIDQSTFSGNSTFGDNADGGAVFLQLVFANVENSTVSGNSTFGATANGGGIHANAGTAQITNSTIAGNTTEGDGGGVHTADSPDPAVQGTIISDNSAAGTGPDLESVNNTFQVSFSLIEDPTSAPFNNAVAGSNILGMDPQLGLLQNNGGPTRTHAVPANSPAVDCGRDAFNTFIDQRGLGFPRPVDQPGRANSSATGADGSDIGAFELQGSSASGACPTNVPAPSPGVTPPTTLIPPTQPPPPVKKKRCKKKRGAAAAKRCRKKK